MIPLYAYASTDAATPEAAADDAAAQTTLRPALLRSTDERVRRFERALERARASSSADDRIQPPHTMAQLMHTLMLVDRLDEPAPGWLVDTVRAAGIDRLATVLEARNHRMQQRRHVGRAEGASHTG